MNILRTFSLHSNLQSALKLQQKIFGKLREKNNYIVLCYCVPYPPPLHGDMEEQVRTA